ncbi:MULTISPECIES: ABC transporter ATP-binding protein [unclassified Lactobacillus]|uniref:ATP-binding cassette domain-containing protein n=1 Tax=unclassified Lactobacillus TaxID=2620435 RepID=UPI000EFD1A30|nr:MULTISPECIES: ABC transporter ATP-binding protein [unclassified Lactobacillus]RMC39975.1 ABC transporter ATP-binding protein [Lactobacillus sp. ESL0237]RMC44135.1 ABC transporter ATP-binding protein [Lactobacillus sp. ESL0234]RMC45463.1 ABC transporter ATP-binding protein [Lactobacillus sp. ESL0236]RMC46426.1 ABC transporter ATP-binding protein [Lactobacillus sp. ESL0230]RMC50728.1 ABC transporter ATP-binding protein [Lactobacillus sp. ESL0225]
MDNLLEIKDLTYKKNQKIILDKINLELQPGKIVALLGENGAGKTTLMRIIAGMAKNYQGSVTLLNETKEAMRKAHLSFTDGLTGFGESTKIQDIVHFYQVIYTDFDDEQFNQLRSFMKLDLNMRLSHLSKGMREKLIIALTFSRKADLYLLDEPFSGIDAMARKKIINSIILWKADQATILISDHFVNEIATMLDEVVVIKDKTVLTHQSTEAIRANNLSIEEYYEGLYLKEDE